MAARPRPLVHRLRPAAGEPAGALVLLHGRGVDESDLFPLLDALDPERRLVGATPRGPLTLPPGGHHWYIVERVGFPHRETFMESFGLLTAWLDALRRGDRRAVGADGDRRLLAGRRDGVRARAGRRAARRRPACSR